MCLTIPKKVIMIGEGTVIVETPTGGRQEVKSIVDLNIGDYCLTQQNVAIEKISQKEAKEVLAMLQEGEL